jgi:hypothetical protein
MGTKAFHSVVVMPEKLQTLYQNIGIDLRVLQCAKKFGIEAIFYWGPQ